MNSSEPGNSPLPKPGDKKAGDGKEPVIPPNLEKVEGMGEDPATIDLVKYKLVNPKVIAIVKAIIKCIVDKKSTAVHGFIRNNNVTNPGGKSGSGSRTVILGAISAEGETEFKVRDILGGNVFLPPGNYVLILRSVNGPETDSSDTIEHEFTLTQNDAEALGWKPTLKVPQHPAPTPTKNAPPAGSPPSLPTPQPAMDKEADELKEKLAGLMSQMGAAKEDLDKARQELEKDRARLKEKEIELASNKKSESRSHFWAFAGWSGIILLALVILGVAIYVCSLGAYGLNQWEWKRRIVVDPIIQLTAPPPASSAPAEKAPSTEKAPQTENNIIVTPQAIIIEIPAGQSVRRSPLPKQDDCPPPAPTPPPTAPKATGSSMRTASCPTPKEECCEDPLPQQQPDPEPQARVVWIDKVVTVAAAPKFVRLVQQQQESTRPVWFPDLTVCGTPIRSGGNWCNTGSRNIDYAACDNVGPRFPAWAQCSASAIGNRRMRN